MASDQSFFYEFRRQMETLSRWTSVVTADYQGTLPNNNNNNNNNNSVAITFDDAFVSVVENAVPELSARSFPCTIFVPVDFISQPPGWKKENQRDTFQETVMTRAQLTSQPKFVMFGSHGKSHVHLSRIDPASARIEIEESRRVLQEILGRTVRLIAMPFGDFNSNTIEACRLAGYTHVYTLSPENIDPSRPKFVRGRVSVDPTDGPIEFFEGQWCVRVVKP